MFIQFHSYIVHDDGRVFAMGSKKTSFETIQLAFRKTDQGYLKVNLSIDGKRRRVLVHRLVAHLFLGMELNDEAIDVHHKNKIVDDNRSDNLELVSCATHIAMHFKENNALKYPNDSESIKECRKCNELKPRSEFYVKPANSDKTSSWCKQCSRNNEPSTSPRSKSQ